MAFQTVTASMFGGPSDSTSGSLGYKQDNLYQHPDTFAELSPDGQSVDGALGFLPYMTPITVAYKGRSMVLYKRDIGRGGPGLNGHVRAVDLWYSAAQKLGFSGLDDIQIDIGAKAGGVAGLGGTGTIVNGSPHSTYQFTVGSTSNPDEDNWTAVNRLAQEVNWYLFSDAETVYYIDGADLIAQAPGGNAYIDRRGDAARINRLEFTWDRTAYQYVSTHKRKGKVQHHTKLAKTVSPTSATLELICGIDEFRAGDLIVLSSCGPGDGRWLIADVRRSVFSPISELNLVPPMMPLSEQQVAGTGGQAGSANASSSSTATGTIRQKIVQIAQKAAGLTAGGHYSYAQVRPYPSTLFGSGTCVTDCSGFVTLCYKEAGAADPNNAGFDGQGFTGTLESNGRQTASPQPGDLAFWSSPDHVGVYVGGGNVIEFGGNPGPVQIAVTSESGYHAAFLGYRTYL